MAASSRFSIAGCFSTSPRKVRARSRSTTSSRERARDNLSLREPRFCIHLDELFRSRTSRQSHRERTAFAFDAEIDVEERAAAPFLIDPFSEHRERLRVGGKAEFVAVRQFAHPGLDGS